jgi:anti-sigma B factor antagonist
MGWPGSNELGPEVPSALPASNHHPGLDIASHEEPDGLHLLVVGDLDRSNAWALTAAVIRSDKAHVSTVIVDIGGVAFIDAGGLRAITDAARRARRKGCDFALANPTEHIARLLRLTGLDNSLKVLGEQHH